VQEEKKAEVAVFKPVVHCCRVCSCQLGLLVRFAMIVAA
jgi:hypothetical protein